MAKPKRGPVIEAYKVRRLLKSYLATWHGCGLKVAERGLKKGRLCDSCLDGIAADMKELLRG